MFQLNEIDFEVLAARNSLNSIPKTNTFFYEDAALVKAVSSYMGVLSLIAVQYIPRGYFLYTPDKVDFQEVAQRVFGSCFGPIAAPHFKMEEQQDHFVFYSMGQGVVNLRAEINDFPGDSQLDIARKQFATRMTDAIIDSTNPNSFKFLNANDLVATIERVANTLDYAPIRSMLADPAKLAATKRELLRGPEGSFSTEYTYPTDVSVFKTAAAKNKTSDIQVLPTMREDGTWQIRLKFSKAILETIIPSGTTDSKRRFAEVWEWFSLLCQSLIRGYAVRRGRPSRSEDSQDEEFSQARGSALGPVLFMPVGTGSIDSELFSERSKNNCTFTEDFKVIYTAPVDTRKLGEIIDAKADLAYCLNQVGLPQGSVDRPYQKELFARSGQEALYPTYVKAIKTLYRNRGSVLEVNWGAGVIAKLGSAGNLVMLDISGSAPLTDEPTIVSIEGNDKDDADVIAEALWKKFSFPDYVRNVAVMYGGFSRYARQALPALPTYDQFFNGEAPFFASKCELKSVGTFDYNQFDRAQFAKALEAINSLQATEYTQDNIGSVFQIARQLATAVYGTETGFSSYSYDDDGLTLSLPPYWGVSPLSNIRAWEKHSVTYRLLGYISRICAIKTLKDTAAAQRFFSSQDITRVDVMFDKCVPIFAMYSVLNEWDSIKEKVKDVREKRKIDKDKDYPKTEEELMQKRISAPYITQQMMPHQAVTLNVIQRTTPAPDEINEGEVSGVLVDIQPGGGKTYAGMTDVFILMYKNWVKKPVFIVPNNLMASWIKEIKTFTFGRVNVIAINSRILRKWEDDKTGNKRITKILANLPPNSVILTTPQALSAKSTVKAYLNRVVPDFKLVRILAEWGADLMALDESHKVKTSGSEQHQAVTALRNIKTMKYVRLLSGTLVSNTPKDLVGQMKFINPYTLGSAEKFSDRYMAGTLLRPGKAPEIRSKINEGTTMTSVRRTEWAHMLPQSNEEIHYIRAPREGEGAIFIQIYNAMLYATLEQLKASAKDDPNSRKALDVLTGKVDAEDVDTDSENAGDIESLLNNSLSTLEQFCIDPKGFIAAALKKQVGPEDEMVARIIQEKFANVDIPASPKITDPKDGLIAILRRHFDPSVTKPEGAHCVLVIGHHKRGIEAMYDLLPDDLKAVAATAYGGNVSNVDRLGKDIKILIGTDGTIGTGLNLQAASRLIRMEIPWTSGTIEQTLSRVLRPTPPIKDPVTGNTSKNPLSRNQIWLDWLVTENTFEVAKMTRIISKIITNTQFYMAEYPEITAGIDSMAEKVGSMNADTFQEFFSFKHLGIEIDKDGNHSLIKGTFAENYAKLLRAQNRIYERETKDMLRMMVPIIPLPPQKGAEIIDAIRWSEEDQAYTEGVVPLPTLENLEKDALPENLDLLLDRWATGSIPNLPYNDNVTTDEKGTKLQPSGKTGKGGMKLSDAEKRRLDRQMKAAREKQEREDAEKIAKLEADLERKKKEAEEEAERLRNQQNSPRDGRSPTPRPDTQTNLPGVNLWLEVYNGMLALSIEQNDEAEYSQLKPLGFKKIPAHLVGRVTSVQQLKKFRAKIESRGIKLMGKEELASLDALERDFMQARNNPQLLNHSRYFYTFVNTLKAGQAYFFPVIDADRNVWLMGRQEQGVGAGTVGGITFVKEDPCYTAVFTSKKSAKAVIAELKKLYTLTNGEEVEQTLKNWNIKPAAGPTQPIRVIDTKPTPLPPPAPTAVPDKKPKVTRTDDEVRLDFADYILENVSSIDKASARNAMKVLSNFDIIPEKLGERITKSIRRFQANEIDGNTVIKLLVQLHDLFEDEFPDVQTVKPAPAPAPVQAPSEKTPKIGPRPPVTKPASVAPTQVVKPVGPVVKPVTKPVQTTPTTVSPKVTTPVAPTVGPRAPSSWFNEPTAVTPAVPSIRVTPKPSIRIAVPNQPTTKPTQKPAEPKVTKPASSTPQGSNFSLDDDEELI